MVKTVFYQLFQVMLQGHGVIEPHTEVPDSGLDIGI